jgi:hypothetical protein
MTKLELEQLGLSEKDVMERLVDRLCEQLIEGDTEYAGLFGQRVEKAVKERVDAALTSALENHVVPKISEMVDGICLQETNAWGEKKGEKLTFTEYLVSRVDAYIREEVNHNGKARSEDSYSWTKRSTRIAYMIHEHLQYNIEAAVKTALGEVNSSVRKGLEGAVKEALDRVKVTVNTKVEN